MGKEVETMSVFGVCREHKQWHSKADSWSHNENTLSAENRLSEVQLRECWCEERMVFCERHAKCGEDAELSDMWYAKLTRNVNVLTH